MRRDLTRIVLRTVLLLAAATVPSGFCFAWCGPGCCVIDDHTRYMWSRTWHGPNALATPLTQYYTPREPGRCGSGSYGGSLGCQDAVNNVPVRYGALPYRESALVGLEPVQSERLGKVPNEMSAIVGEMGPLPATPASAPRR